MGRINNTVNETEGKGQKRGTFTGRYLGKKVVLPFFLNAGLIFTTMVRKISHSHIKLLTQKPDFLYKNA